jgi:hypothetical protein
MAGKLVTVAQFVDSAQADLAKQLLADFGIESVLAGQNAASIFSGVPAVANIKLQVIERRAEEAVEILESNKKQGQ